jgi:hypothetical protein
MVLDVSGSMYNGFDNITLEELRQRIVWTNVWPMGRHLSSYD